MDTTKDRILSAAVALFAAEGYEAVFITDDHVLHRSSGFGALETK